MLSCAEQSLNMQSCSNCMEALISTSHAPCHHKIQANTGIGMYTFPDMLSCGSAAVYKVPTCYEDSVK